MPSEDKPTPLDKLSSNEADRSTEAAVTPLALLTLYPAWGDKAPSSINLAKNRPTRCSHLTSDGPCHKHLIKTTKNYLVI
jgi:hypothetical protein